MKIAAAVDGEDGVSIASSKMKWRAKGGQRKQA